MTLPDLVTFLRDNYRVEFKSLEDEVHNSRGPLPTRYLTRVSDTGKVRSITLPAISPEDSISWILIERICAALDIDYHSAFSKVDGFPHAD